jgi:signal transduction histidine kinase
LSNASVLIVSDDTDFARTVAARWQAQRRVPEITLTNSDVWQAASAHSYNLVIVGPVQKGKISAILYALSANASTAVVCVSSDAREASTLSIEYPYVLVMPREDGWIGTLILVAGEALRRTEAVARAQRAERMAIESQRDATLGRYMLEMRPSLNNALTSVLGNADLLMLDPGQLSLEGRHQIKAIHEMALRLNEITQRFSSLAAEMRAGEKELNSDALDALQRT